MDFKESEERKRDLREFLAKFDNEEGDEDMTENENGFLFQEGNRGLAYYEDAATRDSARRNYKSMIDFVYDRFEKEDVDMAVATMDDIAERLSTISTCIKMARAKKLGLKLDDYHKRVTDRYIKHMCEPDK